MSLTFDLFKIQSVPPDYSWDEGTPLVSYPNDKLITNVSANSSILVNEETELNEDGFVFEFIGYAPFVTVSLSSEVIEEQNSGLSALAIERVVDFGDYYNSQTNIVKVVGDEQVLFCHNFIMPGKYIVAASLVKHFAVNRTLPNFENFSGIYVQPTEKPERFPLSWQWNNFLSFSPLNIKNTPITWEQTSLLREEQLTWNGASGPCYDFDVIDAVWKWNQTLCESASAFTLQEGVLSGLNLNPYNKNIKWKQTEGAAEINRTWREIRTPNCFELVPSISSVQTDGIIQALLHVKEISPIAYLSAVDLTPGKQSPLTVRLTPRFTKAGSFPIEKIVWDLGDGSPLLTQTRANPIIDQVFAFSDTLTADWKDPRNFDVIHTYTKTSETEFAFYPSITAYASSTSTSDTAATIVGPLKLQNPSEVEFTILQNELTNHGKTIIADVRGNVAAWKASITQ